MSSYEKSTWNSVPPISTKSSTCWNWLLFSPDYYYSDSINIDVDNDKTEFDLNFLACLPTCLLALLYLTPKLISSTTNENEHEQELKNLDQQQQQLLNSNSQIKSNRSSTPDTDDGYQSASDASRSDCSQISSTSDSSIPRRLSYAAAAKPIQTLTNKLSSYCPSIPIEKSTKQILHTNDLANLNGQKLKFIAPRFERMHHAKQHSSNRTQVRSTNHIQRNTTPTTTTTTLTRRR